MNDDEKKSKKKSWFHSRKMEFERWGNKWMNQSIMKSHLQHEEIRKSIGCFVFKMIDNGFNYFCNLGNNGIDVPVVSDKVITKQFF